MNLLADEGVDRPIVLQLRQDGHTVWYIAEKEPGIDDTEILGRANEQGSVLLAPDKDFGELVYRQKRLMGGVILLRLSGLSSSRKAMIVADVVRRYESEFWGAFSVIVPGHIRIRRRDR